MKLFFPFITMFSFFCLQSCGEQEYTPKPRGYNKIDLPEQKYEPLGGQYPFTFQKAKGTHIRPDSSKIAKPHWIYIIYPQFKANIQLTYYRLDDAKNPLKKMQELNDDALKLTSKHMVKADMVENNIIKTPKGKIAVIQELEGEVPSQFQFFTSDSSKHFLRGALYFKTATKNDSLAPIIDFIKKDIIHLINTLEWK
jgi:gliding motility-associated lipoprotein GldD